MAINLKFDLLGNPEPPSIVLANRNGNKLGQLNVNVDSIDVSDKLNAASEFSFTLNKYIDGEPTPLWDKVKDFKLVYCPEWDIWFEIKVETDESTETVKTVFCTQLGQAELSQIKVYNIHINEEGDPNWDTNNETYKSTILYDPQNTDASLLHRLLKDKAPHYSIAYVDESIQRIQKTFSFDDTSICDAFDEIAEEIGCLFVYNSNSTKGGKPSRTISVYDLQQNCNDCGYRGEFTDECPKCESKNIDYGYGEDTTIFVTSDELATEGIQLVTDVDSVKNCFKLEGGDDLMTATIRNCNPNGSDYIWYFSDALKEDMSKELVEKLESYDEKYQRSYNEHTFELNVDVISQYNELVEKYNDYYDTKSTCLTCGTKGYFYEQCSNASCNSKNILIGKQLQSIPTIITGYSNLMTAYYNTIDLLLYLESGLMPNVEMSDTSAAEQLNLLTTATLSPVAVNVNNISSASLATADSAVLSMAKVLVKPTYKVVIKEDSSSLSGLLSDSDGEYKTWTGKFVVTNYSDETDTASHSDDETAISVRINNATETFIKQKIEKTLNKENTDDYSITGLFAKDYDEFCVELQKYALNPLKSFSEACDTCLSVLTEQGVGNEEENKDLYDALYKPYFDKQQAIHIEMQTRQDEIAIIEGAWDRSDENNPQCTTWGLQQYIEECQQDIQQELDFEKYLGENLWLEFCAYRREDTYSNSNYISDGLNNAELFDKALEFIEVAKEEIFKSAELQHSISATLNNLLSLDKFKPLLKSLRTGNWIRVQVDDKVYKLRLLEYGFGYGSSESISVEFSDVTKIKNGVTDVKKILEQASSMASSYDSVQRQAEKGNIARSTIDQWLIDGLNSSNIQISSNDSEEIILTKNGLLARSYDDITGTYAPEQFKLTHNIMAYTTDDWKTVSSALGKHNYKKWNNNTFNFVDDEDYGLTAKFVNAGYITGSQIVGGEIVSSNYDRTKGTYINLLNGDFDFAGGKIVYDAKDNEVKLKGVTIQWTGEDGVNAPEVKVQDVTGLDEYLDQLADLEDQLDGRIQTYSQSEDPSISWTNEEKLNHIGDLWLNPDNGLTKRWTGSEWVEVTDSDLKQLAESKAQIFVTTPTPPYYIGDLWVQGSTGDIMHCVNDRETGNYVATDWKKSSKYTDDTRADAAYGLADSAKGIAENAKVIGDKLVNGLGFQETEISGEYIISPVIAGGHLLIGNTTGTYAQITTDGKLTCTNANVSGHITATSLTLGTDVKISTQNISGLEEYDIPDNIITTNDITIESETAANGITTQTIKVGDKEYTSIIAGDFVLTNVGLGTNTEDGKKSYTYISKDGLLTAKNAIIYGTVYATDGEFTGDIKAGSTLKVGEYTDTEGNLRYYTWIDTDGVLNTNNANISGKINAAEGFIGGFAIEPVKDENGTTIGGWLYSGESIGVDKSIFLSATNMSGTVSKTTLDDWRVTVGKHFGIASDGTAYMSNCEITGGYLKMGNVNTGYSVWISSDDGILHAYGASIQGDSTFSGKITATNISGGTISGTSISGVTITSTEIVSGTLTSSNISGGTISGSTISGSTISGASIIGGTLHIGSNSEGGYNTSIDKNGILNCKGASISGEIVATSGNIGGCAIENGKLMLGASVISSERSYIKWIYTNTVYTGSCYVRNIESDAWGNITYSYETTYMQDSISFENSSHVIKYIRLSDLSDLTSGSDARLKNSIEILDDKYNTFFDLLTPKRYKYNDGTSNRYHTGYIAQEVVSALESAGLDTTDFAAVMLENAGQENEYWKLRRDEFVSLNTWQIQKLKSRTSSLEAEIELLKAEIKELKEK